MQLTFCDPGYAYMIERILDFQGEDTSPFWSEPLYRFYPQLDKAYAQSLPLAQRRQYLTDTLQSVYDEQTQTLQDKCRDYAVRWETCCPQIEQALSEAFGIDCGQILNDMVCRVSLNPIEPRFLQEHCFDIFYRNSPAGAIGEILHEIIHLVWFYVWQQEFGDGWEEYEAPSLKWILSEMVVESIMRDPRLSSINPYFPREKGGCIYSYFFDMRAEGKLILETLDELYRSQNIRSFMRSSYAYCMAHEKQIRAHMEKAEKGT